MTEPAAVCRARERQKNARAEVSGGRLARSQERLGLFEGRPHRIHNVDAGVIRNPARWNAWSGDSASSCSASPRCRKAAESSANWSSVSVIESASISRGIGAVRQLSDRLLGRDQYLPCGKRRFVRAAFGGGTDIEQLRSDLTRAYPLAPPARPTDGTKKRAPISGSPFPPGRGNLDPAGIRTRVYAVRGHRPRPLDDGADRQKRVPHRSLAFPRQQLNAAPRDPRPLPARRRRRRPPGGARRSRTT